MSRIHESSCMCSYPRPTATPDTDYGPICCCIFSPWDRMLGFVAIADCPFCNMLSSLSGRSSLVNLLRAIVIHCRGCKTSPSCCRPDQHSTRATTCALVSGMSVFIVRLFFLRFSRRLNPMASASRITYLAFYIRHLGACQAGVRTIQQHLLGSGLHHHHHLPHTAKWPAVAEVPLLEALLFLADVGALRLGVSFPLCPFSIELRISASFSYPLWRRPPTMSSRSCTGDPS
ncbi:hypothetical protein BJ166DRAFT_66144 [Pestalotiopsis sp. NC0098]|nr:hypothetical protein BJ166DRAFT_66144 [Pestalotiopsis sp. NC0098]